MNDKKDINDIWKSKKASDMEIVPQEDGKPPATQIMSAMTNSAPEVGLIGRWRLAKTQNNADVKKLQVIAEAEVDALKMQAAAAKKEAEVVWNGRASMIAEQVKTFVQNKLNGLDVERSDNRMAHIHEAGQKASDRVIAIATDASLPDEIKELAIEAVKKEFTALYERITNDALARKNGLI